MSIPLPFKRLKDDLREAGFKEEELWLITKGIRKCNETGYRERHVMLNYEKIKVNNQTVHVIANDGTGFIIDTRRDKVTFGNVCG